ncbi:chromate transporter [Aquipuribacter sp. MA13-6]|uniref:chromate transporter n=1 Tax=unclassified Aquipuribacter TaxID=2635084 RepID=UPI003EEFDA0B
MLTVGTVGFGGGSALIPLVEDQLVRRRRVLDAETFTQHAVVASITPGALPVKLGGLAGLHTSGAGLALVLSLAVALPGTAATLALVTAVAAGGSDLVRLVELASVGITVFIIALLVHYGQQVVGRHAGRPVWPLAVIVVVAALTGADVLVELGARLIGRDVDPSWPALPAVGAIALGGVVVAARAVARAVRSRGVAAPPPRTDPFQRLPRRLPVVSTVLVLASAGLLGVGLAWVVTGADGVRLMGLVLLSTTTSFGGGEAYVGVADAVFVGGGHVDSQTYYSQLVPIANALPGPILVKLAAAVSFDVGSTEAGLVGAWSLGAAAAVVAVTSCTAVAVLVMAGFSRVQGSPVARDIGAVVLPVICGLLLTTAAAMLGAVADVAESEGTPAAPVLWACVLGVVAVLALRHRRIVPDAALVIGCGGLGAALLLLL